MWCDWMPLTFPTCDWHVQCMRKLSVKLWGFWLLEVAFGCDNTCVVLACSGEHKRSPRNPVTGSETKSIKEHRAASKSRRKWVEVLAKMYVHGHQNASEVLASMINLKSLSRLHRSICFCFQTFLSVSMYWQRMETRRLLFLNIIIAQKANIPDQQHQ